MAGENLTNQTMITLCAKRSEDNKSCQYRSATNKDWRPLINNTPRKILNIQYHKGQEKNRAQKIGYIEERLRPSGS